MAFSGILKREFYKNQVKPVGVKTEMLQLKREIFAG